MPKLLHRRKTSSQLQKKYTTGGLFFFIQDSWYADNIAEVWKPIAAKGAEFRTAVENQAVKITESSWNLFEPKATILNDGSIEFCPSKANDIYYDTSYHRPSGNCFIAEPDGNVRATFGSPRNWNK